MWLRHECAGVANTSRFGAESEQIYLVICDRILLGLTTLKATNINVFVTYRLWCYFSICANLFRAELLTAPRLFFLGKWWRGAEFGLARAGFGFLF